MKINSLMLAAFGVSFLSFPAHAIDDIQYQRITQLGSLNAIALNCRYLDQTKKMKKALVKTLPKRRALGQAFDDKTNEAFLELVKKNEACPTKEAFSTDVDSAIDSLYQAFKTQ